MTGLWNLKKTDCRIYIYIYIYREIYIYSAVVKPVFAAWVSDNELRLLYPVQ